MNVAHSTCSLKYSIPKEILIVFHIKFNYDYHFIMKKLAEECEGKFNCLGENTEKYITFSVPIKDEVTRIDKNGKEITKTIFYRLQFIDSTRFMASSLSNLIDSLFEGIHKIKCTNCNKCCLEYIHLKDS